MSLHFNLNLNIEFGYDTPKGVINLFEKKMKRLNWEEKDKQIIPFQNEIEYLFDTNKYLREQCLQTFHFQKQEYLGCPEFRKFESEFYCFHLSRTINDDGFYQGGYELIVWLAQFSRTNGYLGEFHEPESRNIRLLFCEYGIVTVQATESKKVFKMSPKDFNMAAIDMTKKRIYDEFKAAFYSTNYKRAEEKIEELIEIEPQNFDFKKLKEFIKEKRNTTANKA